MNKAVDAYLSEGCGRCPLGGTPACKVHNWTTELNLLRMILLESELKEELKWGVPCYTYQGANVAMLGAFKQCCALSFMKGVLLNDADGILELPGENTQAGRLIRFTNPEKITQLELKIKALISEAIEIEKKGLKVEYKKRPEPLPDELQNKMDEDPLLKNAFESLTPGRQRGYILYFSAPKQPKTREARIEKYRQKILDGEGLHDRYS